MTTSSLRNAASTLLLLLALLATASAGGPLAVGGPSNGASGQPFLWNAAGMPIQYRVDVGPMATYGGKTIITNATGLTRVQAMLAIWQSAPHTSLQFQYAGPILDSGGSPFPDVATASQFNTVVGLCDHATESPIIFDDSGGIIAALGLPPDIIGFAAPCQLDPQSGYIKSAFALLNGQFQDGVAAYPNFELTASQFDQAITHEIGHFLGLDHSQINDSILNSSYPCPVDKLAGVPLMFPILSCQAKVDAGLPILAPDDQAWIAKFYPSGDYNSAYGTIRGTILFPDGRSALQGANVIARDVNHPLEIAFSVVSGYRFTGNPGQSITGDNTGGSQNGSRDATLIGYYEIPVPPGTYTVEIESIDPSFQGGSGMGPLDPPIPLPGPHKYWHSDQSPYDDPTVQESVTVNAGQTTDHIDIILNGNYTRFDQFEDSGAWQEFPEVLRKIAVETPGEPA